MVITPVEVFLGMVRVIRYRSGNRSNKIKVKPAEVICASCMFCTIEQSRLERFLLTEQDWVRYNLLKNTIQTRMLMDLDLKEYDVEEIRRALEYDFEYFNDFTHGLLTSDDEKGLCTLDEMEEIAREEAISQYNVIYLIFSVYSRLLAKQGARDLIRQCLDLTEKKKTVNKNDALSDANDIMTMRNALKEKLKDKVKGQDLAVDKFVDGFMRYKIRGSVSGKPAAVYLFAGPPGTGKTYMAETFAKLVADEGYKYKRFDMSAFGGNGNDNITGLVGFEKTWKASQPGLLTEFVRKNPKCILLFDEIEKAGAAVRMLFLSVLEGAVLTDRYYDKQVSFEDAILIFTTNEGKDLYEDNRSVNLTTLSDAAVIEGLRESQFAPELISRLMSGNVVMFNHLSYSNMSEIFKVSVNNTMAGLGRDRFKFTMRRPEELQQLYFLNKGANIDARFVSSNTKKMVEDYFLQAMEYLGKQEEEAL
ncbi:MAG: AAA family ATPase [Lachnospiraceae bacterium]|nr:AAA family ATPase [Lachnospiraceae bacterium]